MSKIQASECAAIILAAGLGTRMRPLTDCMPKPLIEVAGRPLIAYALDRLSESGLRRAVINTHYRAPQMRDYITTIEGIDCFESYEAELLETGGGIQQALPLLGDGFFFALNSDTITLPGSGGPVLQRMAEAFDPQHMALQMLLVPLEHARGYDGKGDFIVDWEHGRFRRRREGEQASHIFSGIQLLHPRLFDELASGPYSMARIWDRFKAPGSDWFEGIGLCVHDGPWLHVGDPEAIRIAEQALANDAPLIAVRGDT